MNLGELKTAIRANTHRPSLSDSDLERHIDATAIAIGRDAELFKQSKVVTVAASETGLPLASIASDFLRETSISVPRGDGQLALYHYTRDQALNTYRSANHVPVAYYWEGAKLFIVPFEALTLTIEYKQRIPTLFSDGATNDILTDWPEAYEFGATYRAGLQYQDDDIVNKYKPFYDEEIAKLIRYTEEQEFEGTAVRFM